MIRLTNLTDDLQTQQQLDQLASLPSWGSVADDGTVVTRGSGDWYVVKNSTGSYTVMFMQPRGEPAAVMVSPATALTFSVVSVAGAFTAVFGAPTNTAFMFVALGG